jgi:hypothetical protein
MPTLNNYTVSDAVFSVIEGSSIYGTQQTATLTITPNTGFTVDYQDFSVIPGTLPSEINSVIFQQSGANVLCIATFNQTAIMPSENVTLNLCIEGSANEKKFYVSGGFGVEWANFYVDVAMDPLEKIYYAEGVYGEKVKIAEYIITAPNPLYEIIPNTDITNLPSTNYSYTIIPSYDINGYYVSSLVEVFYTFPNFNFDAGLDNITLFTGGVQIFVEEPVLTAYTISNTNVSQNGMFINMTLYANPGAEISLEIYNGSTTEQLLTDYVFDNYSYQLQIEIPAVLADTVYLITLTGDLSSTFDTVTGQSSQITINQYVDTTVSIDAVSGGSLVTSGLYSRTSASYSIPLLGSYASQIAINWDVVDSGNGDLNILDSITRDSFSNAAIYYKIVNGDVVSSNIVTVDSTSDLTPGMQVKLSSEQFAYAEIVDVLNSTEIELDTFVSYFDGQELEISNNLNTVISPNLALTLSVDLKTVNISGTVEIEQYGKGDITFSLNLDNIIAIAPISGLSSGLISENGLTTDTACSLILSEPIYMTDSYTEFYTDPAGTIPFDGQNLYWAFRKEGSNIKYASQINSAGVNIGSTNICL